MGPLAGAAKFRILVWFCDEWRLVEGLIVWAAIFGSERKISLVAGVRFNERRGSSESANFNEKICTRKQNLVFRLLKERPVVVAA